MSEPIVGLMRRFAVDWLDRADERVCAQIMDPGYTVHIGGAVLTGLDAYVPATLGQLAAFPGLVITVHDLVATDNQVAMRFTEHGASADGGAAAWRGIGLFRSDGHRLVRNVTEEDYLSRRRQLVDGTCDAIDPPMAAPWTQQPADPDATAEATVRTWLAAGHPVDTDAGIVLDDGRTGPAPLDVERTEVTELFSAGDRVAFHVLQHGRYAGGLPAPAGAVGREATLGVAGILRAHPDGTITGHAVRDRAGLRRRLRS